MFTRRKQELNLLQRSIESLENSQKNTELMVASVCQMIGQQNFTGREEVAGKFSEEEKRRAAYALNLCTVSVSQIIDYNDVNILEQEYETILNNLNLENMPKDEALLNILKQLLDTVTFFRIQEGDKKIIEKEYQHKMKNAIWSAVPNFGVIIAGGNFFTAAVALASQVGIGYMNYRKAKAGIELEKEREEWQLQRAAIEQLNGLRRELFDASWRLADKYEFPDEYRLTERQITQYNEILMDVDNVRKYERLESVQLYFEAYPPFWYYFGHAANEIAQDAERDKNVEVYNKYKELALSHFKAYMQKNKYALLREDQITSSCALEYIDLLDIDGDKEIIKELLVKAENMSGRECDILQLCAIAYLRLGEIDSAIRLLKYLINESYNDVTNAQLLSYIYVTGYIADKTSDFSIQYTMLTRKVNEDLLFPFPKAPDEDFYNLTMEYFDKQREVLLNKYKYVVREYIKKSNIQFNQCIPVPYEGKKYPDSFFSDQEEYRIERYNQYMTLFSNKEKANRFVIFLASSNLFLAYLDSLNEMLNVLEKLVPDAPMKRFDAMQQLAESVEQKILEKRDELNDLQEKMSGNFTIKEFNKLWKISYEYFTKDFYQKLSYIWMTHVSSLDKMADISKEDTMLLKFCREQGIPEFKISSGMIDQSHDEDTGKEIYLSSELLGGDAFERAQKAARARKISKEIDKCAKDIVLLEKYSSIITKYHIGNNSFRTYFQKKKYVRTNDIVAVIKNKSIGSYDLIFTIDGIIVDKSFTRFDENPSIIPYSKVTNENNELKFAEYEYKNMKKAVNTEVLYKLTQSLAEIVAEDKAKETPGGQYISYNSSYIIEDMRDYE